MCLLRKTIEFSLFLILMSATCSAQTVDNFAAIATSKFGKDPRDKSDIVGRDLNVVGLGSLGHVGLWTGDRVIEALHQTPAVVQNTLQDFKSRSSFWGTVYYPEWNSLSTRWMPTRIRPPYTDNKLFTAKEAALQRARLIQLIGAEYTLFYRPNIAVVRECSGLLCSGPIKGKYRCDTFVKDAYIEAGVEGISFDSLDTPSTLWSSYVERRR